MEEQTIKLILVKDIIPNPEQPRRAIRNIDGLAKSMREIGQLTPISVFELSEEQKKKHNAKARYMLANGGERRWTAAKKLNWEKVKAVIEEPNFYAMLAENLARENLNVIEKIEGVTGLLKKELGDDWRTILGHVCLGNEAGGAKRNCVRLWILLGFPQTLFRFSCAF